MEISIKLFIRDH